jgi:hypothetical protein
MAWSAPIADSTRYSTKTPARKASKQRKAKINQNRKTDAGLTPVTRSSTGRPVLGGRV